MKDYNKSNLYVAGGSGIKYSTNGTSWTTVNSLNTARSGIGGAAGIQTAAIYFGGFATVISNITESWNGTSWTTVNSMNTARRSLAGAGIQTAALAFGGSPTPGVATGATEKYNGTSWTTSGSMVTARDSLAGAGTNTAGLGFGGYSNLAATEEFTDPVFAVQKITTS